MLRLPPTQVELTSSDLLDFNERMITRRYRNASQSHLRLSRGPNHHTEAAIVPQENNVGRKRAASSCSEATICELEDETQQLLDDIGNHHRDSAEPVLFSPIDRRQSSRKETVDHEEGIARETNVLLLSTPVQPLPSFINGVHPTLESVNIFAAPMVDAANNLPSLTHSSTPPFSSARARRRYGRSQGAPIFNDPSAPQRHIEADHLEQATSSHRDLTRGLPPAIPELVLSRHGEIMHLPPNPALDPCAPVFVPRTRFGSTTRSTASSPSTPHGFPEPSAPVYWRNLDSCQSFSNLRTRPPSEQNVHAFTRPRRQPTSLHSEHLQPRQRAHSRTSDQNIDVSSPPTVHEIQTVDRQRETRIGSRDVISTGLDQFATGERLTIFPSSSALFPNSQISLAATSSHIVVGSAAVLHSNSRHPSNLFRSASSASSLISSPSTNFSLPFRSLDYTASHSASHSWSHNASRSDHILAASQSHGDPSGTMNDRAIRVPPPTFLDPTINLVRLNHSPLDDLTDRLSRINAARPRSVGRSWGRSSGDNRKVSLLSGSLFTSDSSPSHLSSEYSDSRPSLTGQDLKADVPDFHTFSDFENASSASIPTNSTPEPPLESSLLRSTPPACSNMISSPRSPLAHISPTKVFPRTTNAMSAKAVRRMDMAATPRVRVYNDAEPPETQLQTPADLSASNRGRARGQSETTYMAASPNRTRQPAARSPPIVPPRHIHRNTHPVPGTPSQQRGMQQPVPTGTPQTAISPGSAHGSAWRDRMVRRAEVLRNNANETVENDIDGHLLGLEQDRTTWLARRQEGSMETTPPAEGRYERYLT